MLTVRYVIKLQVIFLDFRVSLFNNNFNCFEFVNLLFFEQNLKHESIFLDMVGKNFVRSNTKY